MVRFLISSLLAAAAFSLPVESVAVTLEAPHVGEGIAADRVVQSATGNTAPDPESKLRADSEEESGKHAKLVRDDATRPAFAAWVGAAAASLAKRRVESRPARDDLDLAPTSARAPPALA